MADDLMDFSEFDNDGNDENADPDTEKAPRLMQTPVVRNSILKQSTKDNLIQLFTPVQKNKKLKVHFTPGVIQSPNDGVDGGAEGKSSSEVGRSSAPAGLEQVAVEDDDSEERENWIDRTSVLTKQDHEEYCQYAKEFLLDIITSLPIKDEEPSSDSGIDESMMEVQEESIVSHSEPVEASNGDEIDILLQAANLLKSLRQQTGSTSSEFEVDTAGRTDVPPVCNNRVEETMDYEEPMEVDMSVVQTDIKSSLIVEDTEVTELTDANKPSIVSQEASSYSEEQQLCPDSGTDTYPKDKEDSNLSVDVHEKENDNMRDDGITGFTEQNETTNDINQNVSISVVSVGPEKVKDGENVLEAFDKTFDNSENGDQGLVEVNSKDVVSTNNLCEKIEETVKKMSKTEVGQEILLSSSGKESEDKVLKKDGDVSSDEEFLSADEDMTTEQRKETDHNESPGRTPPKVGYNFNFDDLESMNPFQSKACVQNTPDKIGKDNVQLEKNDIKLNNETETFVDKETQKAGTQVVVDQVSQKEKDVLLHDNTEVKAATHDLSGYNVDSQVTNLMNDEKINNNTSEETSCKEELENKKEKADENNISMQENETDICDAIVQSPPLPAKGSYNLDDLDSIDPFKPRAQMTNSPDVRMNRNETKQTTSEEIDPFKPRKQIMNSPEVSNTDKIVEIQRDNHELENAEKLNKSSSNNKNEHEHAAEKHDPAEKQKKKTKLKSKAHKKEKDEQLPENLDHIDPFKSGDKVMNSPATKQNIYEQLPDNLDDIDPFKPKKQMMNSPLISAKTSNNAADTSKENELLKVEQELKMPSVTKTKSIDFCENLDDIDPFKPKKQIMNSPDRGLVDGGLPEHIDDVDPFKPKHQMMNSPPNKVSVEECLPENLDDIDPFKPKKQIMNSPESSVVENNLLENLEDIDPFKPKKQMINSPVKSLQENAISESLDDIDPFKPQKQIVNSPDRGLKGDSFPENLDDIDPFKPSNKMMTSPLPSNGLSCPDLPDNLDNTDPFKTKSQLLNSPDMKNKTNSNLPDNLDSIDPFKPTKQVINSPTSKGNGDQNKVIGTEEKTISEKAEKLKGAFDDIDPFKPKSQMQNSPKLPGIEENMEIVDPFKPGNQIANSPVGKQQGSAFVSNAGSASSPEKKTDPFVTRSKLPSTPEESFSPNDEVMEVQGVTRRGATGPSNQQGFDIDDSEFVAASEVFKDPGVWEMLEQFGNSASNPVQESALSRMSLYVKFDPLVDTAKVSANPRRISIKPKQLEKVKEYGLDETLLLLGTPPKKRRQSMNVSQLRHTPLTSRGTPSQEVLKRKEGNMGAVDLIMALSPEDSSTGESSRKSSQPSSLLPALDDVDNATEGLFEELKYTNSDMRRLRTDLKLELQGQLIVREKEWCKEKENYEALLKKSQATLELERKGSQEMAKACSMFEETIQKLSAIQENDKKQIANLNKEKQQMLEDIQGVENAFSDLHRRYEKLKTVVEDQRKNEETLKKYVSEIMEKLKKSEEKSISAKKTADEIEAKSAQEIAKLKNEITADQSKHEAARKIMNMKIENLEKQLEQKKEENKNLTDICDQLIQNSEAR